MRVKACGCQTQLQPDTVEMWPLRSTLVTICPTCHLHEHRPDAPTQTHTHLSINNMLVSLIFGYAFRFQIVVTARVWSFLFKHPTKHSLCCLQKIRCVVGFYENSCLKVFIGTSDSNLKHPLGKKKKNRIQICWTTCLKRTFHFFSCLFTERQLQ